MVSAIPARIVGVEDQVGAIMPGLGADFLVIQPRDDDDEETGQTSSTKEEGAYRTVVDAPAADVQLVFIEGVPLYSDRDFAGRFWDCSDLEELRVGPVRKALTTPVAGLLLRDVVNRLVPRSPPRVRR